MMSKQLQTIVVAAFTAAAGAALAATPGSPATGTLGVSASVQNKCTFTTAPVAFGVYDPVTTHASGGIDLDTAGTLNVTCTKKSGSTGANGGVAVEIALDFGANATSSPRQLLNGTSDALNYDLYLPTLNAGVYNQCTYATVWNTTSPTNVLSPANTFWDGTAKAINVCGRIPKGQAAAVGSYTDTVNVTITF